MKRFGVIIILFLTLIGFSFPAAAHAFNVIPNAEDVGAIIDRLAPQDQTSKEVYSFNSQALLMNGITCFVRGCSKIPESQFSYNRSALATLGSGIEQMYGNPPANLALWVRDTGESLGFIPRQAYAQGIGFTGLSPLLNVWKAFRNIAYLLLAFALVVVGFMVMFRKKIDPKTVVTVQNSLPRIVITMLLITFSYAIVGLMIDIMYLFIAFINAIMLSSFPESADLVSKFASGGGFTAFISATFAPIVAMNPLTQLWSNIVAGQVREFFTNFLTGALFTLSGVGPLLQFILSLAFLFAFIRITLLLLNSYVQILLAVLIGPLQILIDVFPGSNGFSSWIKGLVVNLIAFPITIFMLLLGNVLFKNTTGGNLWVAPLLPQPGGLGASSGVGGVGGLALSLISLGIILVIPNIINGIKEALKSKPIVPAGAGAIFAPITGAVQTTMGTASQFYYGQQFIRGIGGIFNKGGGQKPT